VKDIVADLNTKFEIKEHDQNARNIETTNYIEWKDKPVTLEEIKKMVDGCPVCTLAVLRQTQLNYKCVGFSFDFSGDSQKYLNEKREEEAKSDYYGGYVLPREVNRM
jgi:hypothetical protein